MPAALATRTTLAALTLLGALCWSGAAKAGEPYLSGAVGGIWPLSRNASDPATGYGFSDSFSGGLSGDFALGYDAGALRGELSYSVEDARLRSYSDASGTAAYSGGRQGSQALLLNAYWDIPTASRWTPYVGGGLGYGWQRQGNSSSGSSHYVGYSIGGFAWQAKAGISYAATPRADLFGEVVYRGLAGFSASDGATTYAYASSNRLGVQVGARWRF